MLPFEIANQAFAAIVMWPLSLLGMKVFVGNERQSAHVSQGVTS